MRQFFKFIFASCLGTFLAIGLVFFLFFAIANSFSAKDSGIGKNGVLLLDFEAPMPERTDNIMTGQFTFEPINAIGVHHIKDLIKKAETDDEIKGIVFKASLNTSGGPVTHSIIREALRSFRDSTDKFVYSYADFYTNNTYLLAAASDSIFINPNGIIDINGYGALLPFFTDMLDRIGVKMNVFYAGNYKSATEPFRRNGMSPENREQTREFLTDNFDLYMDEVSRERNINESAFRSLINELDFDNVDEAIELGIIDRQMYWNEFEDLLKEKMGLSEKADVNYVKLPEYKSKRYISSGRSKNKIALVYAEGEIMYDSNERGVISEVKYQKIFDKILKDTSYKALVLRVNSPGGSAFSSNVIWRAIEEIKAKGIPVIASMGDYAASGGYYIAAGADTIVANPKTLTGSIGVFSIFPDVSRMFNEKLGIQFDTVKTSPHALVATPFYKLNSTEKNSLQTWTDALYRKFLAIVAEGRGMTIEAVDEVAQGRVWTGQRALEKGLVDVLGDLDDAIDIAAQKAGVSEDYKIVDFPDIKKEPWEQILEDLATSSEAQLRIPSIESELLENFNNLRDLVKYREPMAKLPYVIK